MFVNEGKWQTSKLTHSLESQKTVTDLLHDYQHTIMSDKAEK